MFSLELEIPLRCSQHEKGADKGNNGWFLVDSWLGDQIIDHG